jgi:hypothetical protein
MFIKTCENRLCLLYKILLYNMPELDDTFSIGALWRQCIRTSVLHLNCVHSSHIWISFINVSFPQANHFRKFNKYLTLFFLVVSTYWAVFSITNKKMTWELKAKYSVSYPDIYNTCALSKHIGNMCMGLRNAGKGEASPSLFPRFEASYTYLPIWFDSAHVLYLSCNFKS